MYMAKKQVKNFGKRNVYTIAVLILLAVCTVYIKNKFFRPPFKYYSEFGIELPVNYAVHGIDVSHYQLDIDWKLVKNMKVKNIGIDFAFIKATEGTSYVDDEFKNNMQGCKENDIKRGAYHYLLSSRSGKTQALNFIENVKLSKGDFAPVLDIEQNTGVNVEQLQAIIKDWLDMAEQHYKIKPIIYCNIDYYQKYIAGKFDDYPIWIAHYLVKDKPRMNNNWAFWQHNEHGHITGIRATDVDFNVFNGGKWGLDNYCL